MEDEPIAKAMWDAVPEDKRLDNVAAADAIRREIADALGGEGPQRWLTIDFTADPRWL